MFEDLEISPGFVILYLMVIVAVWVAPAVLKMGGLNLMQKIITTVIMLPITYFITKAVANKG